MGARRSAGERGARPRSARASESQPAAGGKSIEYADFVLRAVRADSQSVAVGVKASPAGVLRRPIVAAFPGAEAQRIRNSFRSGQDRRGSGRMLMSATEAIDLGRRLARVLLPPPVFRLVAQSIAAVGQRKAGGLRLRLDLDETLVDLPWEYLYRPDLSEGHGPSGFLLMDPTLSLVRMAANKRVTLAPIDGAQRMNFVGTMWEGRLDAWDVWREFSQLRRALKPVASYLAPEFAVASDMDVFEIETDNAIFHYAGHCDFDRDDSAYMVREMPTTGGLGTARKAQIADLAQTLKHAKTRLVVLSACNSGAWPVVKPLLKAGIPAVIGINGAVASDSTIEFCTRLYDSLAVGLSLDEAVGRARLAAMEWGQQNGLFDWGLYMVYLQSPTAVLFPRRPSNELKTRQIQARSAHNAAARLSLEHARELEGLNFGEIMSELTRRRVLILGRFSARRLPVLEAIKKQLEQHKNRYVPELFTFERPDSRDLLESILGFAALSRFVIADISEPRSVQSELQTIVPALQSVPVVPIINEGGREFATFASIARRPNVVVPTLRYRNIEDLMHKFDREIVPAAEAKRRELQSAP